MTIRLSMWVWIGCGWCVVALLVVALHRRMRGAHPGYPPEVGAFLLRFENELAAAHPDVEFLGMLPNRFACLLRVAGQETPVGLHDAWRHAEAHPEGFARLVARLVTDITEVGLDRVGEHDFAAAQPLLLPQVRSRQWLDAQGAFGDSALIQRPLNDELVTVYVIDDPQCMVFVCREHLRRWRKSEADLHNLAMANLARLGGDELSRAADLEQPMVLQTGDGFDAARVLLLDDAEGLLVAIPDRDTLWVGNEHGQDLERLMATTESIARQAAHPVSPHVFRVHEGRLAAVPEPR